MYTREPTDSTWSLDGVAAAEGVLLLTPEEEDEEDDDEEDEYDDEEDDEDEDEEGGPKGVDGVLLLLVLLEASVAPTCPGRDDRIFFNFILYSPSPVLCYDSI